MLNQSLLTESCNVALAHPGLFVEGGHTDFIRDHFRPAGFHQETAIRLAHLYHRHTKRRLNRRCRRTQFPSPW